VDNYAVTTGVSSVNAGLVEVGVIRTDEERMISRSVWRAFGLGMSGLKEFAR